MVVQIFLFIPKNIVSTYSITLDINQIDLVPGWRRSNRPSIRDISIIDEDDAEKDAEAAEYHPPESPQAIKDTPIVTQPNNQNSLRV